MIVNEKKYALKTKVLSIGETSKSFQVCIMRGSIEDIDLWDMFTLLWGSNSHSGGIVRPTKNPEIFTVTVKVG